MAEQRDLLPVEHRSMQPKRLRKRHVFGKRCLNAERLYSAEWLRRSRDKLSDGSTLLDRIIAPDCDTTKGPPTSRRDAAVAASVIQWLGTNAGLGFIRTCEQKIDRQEGQSDRLSLLALQREDRERAEREAQERGDRLITRGIRVREQR